MPGIVFIKWFLWGSCRRRLFYRNKMDSVGKCVAARHGYVTEHNVLKKWYTALSCMAVLQMSFLGSWNGWGAKFSQMPRGAMEWTKNEDSDQMYVTLNNAVKTSLLVLGTSGGKADKCTQAVQHVLSFDYRWCISLNKLCVQAGTRIVEVICRRYCGKCHLNTPWSKTTSWDLYRCVKNDPEKIDEHHQCTGHEAVIEGKITFVYK